MSMEISVIIPVYNTKAYLEACLQSVLDNDCAGYEIILVDDGSTDGERPSLCDRLAQAHQPLVRVIHQPNQGLGGARNTGLEAAQGEYLLFLDSDDTIAPETLSLLKSAAASTGADIVAFNFCADDGEGHLTPMTANYVQATAPFSAADRPEFLLSLPSAGFRLWRKRLFMDSGVRYPSQVWYEDIRTSMKLFALAGSIYTLPDHLYRYLARQGSIMRSAKVDRNREIIDAFDDLLGWFHRQDSYAQYADVLCRLCIDHLYLAASVRVLKVDPHHPLLMEFAGYLREHFPAYRKNPYLGQLSKPRKLAFHLLEGRHYRLLAWLFRRRGASE